MSERSFQDLYREASDSRDRWYQGLKNDHSHAKLTFRPPVMTQEKNFAGKRQVQLAINVFDIGTQENHLWSLTPRTVRAIGDALKAAGVPEDQIEVELERRVFRVTRHGAPNDPRTWYEVQLLQEAAPDLAGIALLTFDRAETADYPAF